MNLVTICPDIPDGWKGGIGEAAKLLGVSRNTLRYYAKLGRREGGIDWKLANNGRKQFTGREVKRFWACL